MLVDPDSNNTSVQRGGIPEDYLYGSLPKESEEQAGLNRILEEISSWVSILLWYTYSTYNIPT